MALENAKAHGDISFEEYVSVLDENSGVPKEKFKQIIDQRKAKLEAQQAMQQAMQLGAQFDQADQLPTMPMQGGVPHGMV